MRICHFVDYRGGQRDPSPFIDDYRVRRMPLLERLPGLRGLELFTRSNADDPLLKEEDGPVQLTRLTFGSLDDLQSALNSQAWLAAH